MCSVRGTVHPVGGTVHPVGGPVCPVWGPCNAPSALVCEEHVTSGPRHHHPAEGGGG